MKTYKIIAFALLALLFAGCVENKVEPEYVSAGTLYRDFLGNVSFVVDTAGGNPELTLHITNKSAFQDIEDGYRFILFYTIDKKINEKSMDVSYTGFTSMKNDIIHKVRLDAEVPDSLGNDPITMEDLYISHDYLTLNFSVTMLNYVDHYCYFVKDENKQKQDTVVVNLHHNANGDTSGQTYYGYLTAPILEFKDSSKDYICLEIVSEVIGKKPVSKFLTYKFVRE